MPRKKKEREQPEPAGAPGELQPQAEPSKLHGDELPPAASRRASRPTSKQAAEAPRARAAVTAETPESRTAKRRSGTKSAGLKRASRAQPETKAPVEELIDTAPAATMTEGAVETRAPETMQPETMQSETMPPEMEESAAGAGSPDRAADEPWQMGEWDLHLFNEGTHQRLFDKLGAHLLTRDGVDGVQFSVWAPAAREVSVIGEFNDWSAGQHPLQPIAASGVWTGFIPGVGKGAFYKYYVSSHFNGYSAAKADPFGFLHETPPQTASRVWDLDYEWGDGEWMSSRAEGNSLRAPMSVYEVHAGSWRRNPDEGFRSLSYRELAHELADYVREMGFTHVELLPVMEHPFFGSWGYQTTGYFAPTSRQGTPQDFMYLVDVLHQNGIGVILDWVPSHFPTDEHGLGYFDGTHLFEHADPRQGYHPDWKSSIFNYGRNEVRAFLISSAMFWLEKYHIDGLRVDAVASMLYLDYSRQAGEWIPNRFGGRDNIDALDFLRQLNEAVYGSFPGTQTIAEESTAWPMVSRPTYVGGLGFGMKWDMGWMHDTLKYMSHEPVYRKFHHHELTFRGIYAFTENFVLPLSHDEVVHGKGSLIGKMPGDDWQKFANLRLLLSYMYATPGKKLLFMGAEIAQGREWNHDGSIEWDLLQYPHHAGVQKMMKDLNRLYRDCPALNELDVDPAGFEWLDANDSQQSVLSFIRHGRDGDHCVIAVLNFTPVVRHNYRLGATEGGWWSEIFNSDAEDYGGSGQGNLGGVEAAPVPTHGRRFTLNVTLPPLGCLMFQLRREAETGQP